MTTKSGSIILHHVMSYDGWGHHVMGLGHHMMGCGHHMMGGAIILHHMMSYDGWQFSDFWVEMIGVIFFWKICSFQKLKVES